MKKPARFMAAAVAAIGIAVIGIGTFGAQTALAATYDVPGDFATIQAAIDGGTFDGDTIHVVAGTHTESDVNITKELTIEGDGTAATFLEGVRVLYPKADNITIRDLTIRNSTTGIRFEMAFSTIANAVIDNVHFLNNSSRGIEIHNDTTVANLQVVDSFFYGNPVGIRTASTAVVSGMLVSGSTFMNGSGNGINQATGSGHMENITVDNSTFTDNGDSDIYFTNIRDSEVRNSLFKDNANAGVRAFIRLAPALAGFENENILIQGNTFEDNRNTAIQWLQRDTFLAGPLTIENNVITADVANLRNTAETGGIWLGFEPEDRPGTNLPAAGGPHGPIIIRSNSISFTGTFGAATSVNGITVWGGSYDLDISGNVIDGGNVGGVGDIESPPSSGLYVAVDVGSFWKFPTNSTLDVTGCNTITGFEIGFSVWERYNDDAYLFGELPATADVNVNGNNIEGNFLAGINNGGISGTSEIIDATGNWWGASDGPGAPAGPGSGDGISANVDGTDWLITPCHAVLGNHFQLYKVAKVPGGPKLEPVNEAVDLEDQFGVTMKIVKKPKYLGVPVNKNGEDIVDPAYHLVCYDTKKPKGVPGQGPVDVDVEVTNQFTDGQLLRAKKSKLLCVPSTKVLAD